MSTSLKNENDVDDDVDRKRLVDANCALLLFLVPHFSAPDNL